MKSFRNYLVKSLQNLEANLEKKSEENPKNCTQLKIIMSVAFAQDVLITFQLTIYFEKHESGLLNQMRLCISPQVRW